MKDPETTRTRPDAPDAPSIEVLRAVPAFGKFLIFLGVALGIVILVALFTRLSG